MGATSYAVKQPVKTNVREAVESGGPFRWVLGAMRIALGGIFFWAFLDKLFGLNFTTKAASAWINGGSPTKGYLSSSVGPFAGFFKSIAGDPITNALFMLGLGAVGAALLLGVGVRVAGYAGALMLAMMYASHVPWAVSPSTNPVIDSHVVYALALVGFAHAGAGRTLGLGHWWSRTALVRRFPVLE